MRRTIGRAQLNGIAEAIGIAVLYVATIAGFMYQVGTAAGYVI
jgi:hypothetical protein